MSLDSLLKSNDQITVLVEAVSSAGSRFFSNTGYVTLPTDSAFPNLAYPEYLIKVPRITEELPDDLIGRSRLSWSECVISNPGGVRDSWLDEYWDGRTVLIKIGHKSWDSSLFVTVFRGIASGLQATPEGDLRLFMSDPSEYFNRPIQDALLATGPKTNDPKPITFGTVFNIEPPLIDSANHRYQVHDAAVSSIDDVRVGGLTVAYTASAVNGRFDTNVTPDGRVTADVTGPNTTAVNFINDIVGRLRTALGVTINTDSNYMSQLGADAPYGLGLYIDSSRNTMDVLDEIMTSVVGWWRFNTNGDVIAKVVSLTNPSLSLTEDDIVEQKLELQEVFTPIWRVRVGYKKNYAIQTDGLYGAVTETNRQRYGIEYDIATTSNAATKTNHPLAGDPEVKGTLIVSSANASTVATNLLNLFGAERRQYRATALRRAWQLHAGDVITLTHSRYGLSAGKNFIVKSVSKDLDSRETELVLWG